MKFVWLIALLTLSGVAEARDYLKQDRAQSRASRQVSSPRAAKSSGCRARPDLVDETASRWPAISKGQARVIFRVDRQRGEARRRQHQGCSDNHSLSDPPAAA